MTFSYVPILGIFLEQGNVLVLTYFLARKVFLKGKGQNLCIFLHLTHSIFFFYKIEDLDLKSHPVLSGAI